MSVSTSVVYFCTELYAVESRRQRERERERDNENICAASILLFYI